MTPTLAVATAVAGFAYVIAPGPAFLAAFGLAAAHGRGAAARFVAGHLVGDVVWGALALAALVGTSRIGPTLFDLLGLGCGAYLVWLGARAVFFSREGGSAAAVGTRRPAAAGILFGLTNPKSYPVATAMLTAIALPAAGTLQWSDAPPLLGAALVGFVAADAVIVCLAGLPAVRRLFAARGRLIGRLVGVLFIAFGVRSMAEAGRSLSRS